MVKWFKPIKLNIFDIFLHESFFVLKPASYHKSSKIYVTDSICICFLNILFLLYLTLSGSSVLG